MGEARLLLLSGRGSPIRHRLYRFGTSFEHCALYIAHGDGISIRLARRSERFFCLALLSKHVWSLSCFQEVLIGQLQRKLTELSRNPSPAVGPAIPPSPTAVNHGETLDMESLGLGLAALGGQAVELADARRSADAESAAPTDGTDDHKSR